MKNKIVSILLSISYVVSASMIHKSLEYIDKPASIAAVRKSLGTSPETAQKRARIGTGGISNVDLPRIANEYWRYFTKSEGKFMDLINDETRKNGYKPLGLVADDIKEIEAFIRRFFLTGPSEQGPVKREYLELAFPKIPKFLENEYKHTTYEIIESIVQDDDYSYLGPQEIRVDVADYLFQKYNKEKKDNQGKRYLFSLKNSSGNYLNYFKSEIKTALNSLESQVEYIGNLEDSLIDAQVEYLVVRVDDLNNQKDKLDAILESEKVNHKLKVIIVFDQQDTVIPDGFKVSNSVKNLVVIGRNISKIGDNFLAYCSELQNLDLSLLSNVIQIGNYFLSGCSGLQSIDLNTLLNVTQIGKNFLSYCAELKNIDLSLLLNITQIGDNFFLGCRGLQSIDLSPLSNVVQIGDNFLFYCVGLKNIDLSPLSNVIQIGNNFLSFCSKLQNIDLRPLLKVTKVGDDFLKGYNNLQNVKMTKKFRDLLPESFLINFQN